MLKKLIDKFRRRYVYLSSETGQFVTEEFAKANPKTTVRIRVK